MIIYGSRAIQLAKETIAEPCPHCQTANSIDMYVFQRYAHVFWIPFVPIGKTGATQCAHCKKVMKLREMPISLHHKFNEIKSTKKPPIWMWIGVTLVGLLILSGIIQSGMHDTETSKRLSSPQTGDILEVKKSTGIYTLYKISDVRNDSIAVLPLLYSVNLQTGLSKLESGQYAQYSDEPKMYTREMLSVLLHKGEIIDVIRRH